MTITRIWQAGAELNTLAEWPVQSAGTNLPTISSTKARTGTYSLRVQAGNVKSVGVAFASVTQIRAGTWLNHNGLAGSTTTYQGVLFRWTTPAGNANYLRWKGDTGIELVIAGTVVATISPAVMGISSVDTWYHIGINVFTDATVGWASVYVDGVQRIIVTGINTSTGITEFYCGGSTGSLGGWASYAYFDDCYVDSTEGEADEAVPQKRFLWAVANDNGASSQWVGNDANSVDNYALVDDVTPDADTTYVYTQAVDQKDAYALVDITVPVGYVIVAAIPTALAKRAGVTEEIKLVTFDGTTTILSAAKVPAAAYAPVWDRQPTQPDASAWNETDFNATEFGQQSSGTF